MYESEKWQISDRERKKYISSMTNNLPELRTRAGISQGDLAQVIGISRQTYSAIETGKRDMSWDTYLALCFFFISCRKTHVLFCAKNIYPQAILDRFNDGESAFYAVLYSMSPDSGKLYDGLDREALHAIRAVILAEMIRCSGLSPEEALKRLSTDDTYPDGSPGNGETDE